MSCVMPEPPQNCGVAFGVRMAQDIAAGLNKGQVVDPKLIVGSGGVIENCKVSDVDGRSFVRSIAKGELVSPEADYLRSLLTRGSSESVAFKERVGFEPAFACLVWMGGTVESGFQAYGTGPRMKRCAFVLVHGFRTSTLLQVPVSDSGVASFDEKAGVNELGFASHPMLNLWEVATSLAKH